jgi:hypothetical protein
MSPLFIRIMLHYYYSSMPYVHQEAPTQYPGAVTEIIESAYGSMGLITRDDQLRARYEDSPFTLTPRGQAYVDRLMATPLPRKVETWVFDGPEGDQ